VTVSATRPRLGPLGSSGRTNLASISPSATTLNLRTGDLQMPVSGSSISAALPANWDRSTDYDTAWRTRFATSAGFSI